MKTLLSLTLLAPLTLLGACESSTDHEASEHAAGEHAEAGDHAAAGSDELAGQAESTGHDADTAGIDGAAADVAAASGFWTLDATTLDGQPVALGEWSGKVALVVNVASKCGYTPQYAGLQSLHESLGSEGLVVLGFPSNEFGGQEPGSPEQIREFCESNYGVSFPMFGKCKTGAGDGQSPVYALLQEATGEVPNWNFCKYLIGRDGKVLGFYPSRVAPQSEQLLADISEALSS